MRTVPRSTPRVRAISCSRRSAFCSSSRISGARRSPSAVRRTPRFPRSSSGKPASSSSEFTMCVTPDCV